MAAGMRLLMNGSTNVSIRAITATESMVYIMVFTAIGAAAGCSVPPVADGCGLSVMLLSTEMTFLGNRFSSSV